MRKILLGLSLLAIAGGANAQQANYVAFPEPGQVNDLEEVSVVFPDFYEAEIIVKDEITVTKDGVPVEGVKKSYDENAVIIKLPERTTAPGVYEFTIGKDALELWNDASYSGSQTLSDPITLTYTIGGGASQDVKFQVYPVEGEVFELNQVTFYFPDCYESEIISRDDITVTKDGVAIEGVSANYEENMVYVMLPEPTVDPGTYEFKIGAGALTFWADAAYSSCEDLAQDVTAVYTLVSNLPDPYYFGEYTIDPEPGVVKSLSEISVTFTSLWLNDIDEDRDITVTFNGTELEGVTAEIGINEPDAVIITFDEEQTAVGEYVVNIPPGCLGGYVKTTVNDYNDNYYKNILPIKFIYYIQEPAPAVEYTLTLSFNQPRPTGEGEINIREKDLSYMTFLSEGTDLDAIESAVITMECEEQDFSITAPLVRKGLYGASTMFGVEFDETPEYDGVYKIKVAKGSFGNAAWMANPETGISNDDIELVFTAIGGKSNSIDGIITDNVNTSHPVYNLQGIKVSESIDTLPAGIYIVNGRKVVVK